MSTVAFVAQRLFVVYRVHSLIKRAIGVWSEGLQRSQPGVLCVLNSGYGPMLWMMLRCSLLISGLIIRIVDTLDAPYQLNAVLQVDWF